MVRTTLGHREETQGIGHETRDGWSLEFPWQDAMKFTAGEQDINVPAKRLVLSCVPAYKPVHTHEAKPVDACTPTSRWTGAERDVKGWWCSDVNGLMFVLDHGAFFAAPPGVEMLLTLCCPAGADAWDGWDGGLRSIQ